MEGVERHLSRWLANTLRRNDANLLTRLGLALPVSHDNAFAERIKDGLGKPLVHNHLVRGKVETQQCLPDLIVGLRTLNNLLDSLNYMGRREISLLTLKGALTLSIENHALQIDR